LFKLGLQVIGILGVPMTHWDIRQNYFINGKVMKGTVVNCTGARRNGVVTIFV